MKRCRYAKTYKALRPPMCGGFDGPCDACAHKWKMAQKKVTTDAATEKFVRKTLTDTFMQDASESTVRRVAKRITKAMKRK